MLIGTFGADAVVTYANRGTHAIEQARGSHVRVSPNKDAAAGPFGPTARPNVIAGIGVTLTSFTHDTLRSLAAESSAMLQKPQAQQVAAA